jgi:hypothetical protein
LIVLSLNLGIDPDVDRGSSVAGGVGIVIVARGKVSSANERWKYGGTGREGTEIELSMICPANLPTPLYERQPQLNMYRTCLSLVAIHFQPSANDPGMRGLVSDALT